MSGPYEKSGMFLFVGAAHWAALERPDEDTGLYKKCSCSVSAVGAGVLTRPPFPAAQLEPHRNKGAFDQGSAKFSIAAQ